MPGEFTGTFRDFLAALETKCEMTSQQAGVVRDLWAAIENAVPDIVAPTAIPVSSPDDGEFFLFCWNYDGYHISIDVYENRTCFWFAKKNKMTSSEDEVSINKLPDALIVHLRAIIPIGLAAGTPKVAAA